MRDDLRDAWRALTRAPSFSLVAIATLALAIGGAVSVFSVVDAVVLHGLPYGAPRQIQTTYERADDGSLRVPSYPTFKDWQARAASLRTVIDGFAFVRGDGVVAPDIAGGARQIDAYVTPGFLDLMGTRLALGRTFRPDEETPGAPAVAVISYSLFLKQYAGDAAVLGKRVVIDSVPTTIIGVMPRGFAYPNFGGTGWLPPAFWQPISAFERTHPALTLRGLHVDSRALVRLRAGADSAGVAAAMRSIEQALAREYPADQAHWTSIAMRSLPDELFGSTWTTLSLISGAVALMLLLACANVANLLLVRVSVRGRELGVRAALGAGTWRLARSLFAEAGAIAMAAALIGFAFAAWLVHMLRPFAGERLPFTTDIVVNGRAALFATTAALITTILIGVLPVIHVARGSIVARLRGGSAGAGRAERRARNVLVSVQFAVAITVLIAAGLLIQSVRRVSTVPLGFDPSGTATFSIAPPKGQYDAPAQTAALYERILTAVRAVPSVQDAAAAGGALLSTKVETDHDAGGGTPVTALYHPISTDFLSVMRVPIVAGRGFSDVDMRAPAGLLVTENLAKLLWPGRSAVGNRISIYRASQARADFGQRITLPVVGVVADYRENGPENESPKQVFLPYTLEVWPWMNFVVRAPPSATVLAQLTSAVKAVEPAVTFYTSPSAPATGADHSLSDPRVFIATLMSTFAFVCLVVAAIGLYGIVAYGVAQRRREIGIRIAVGATSGRIIALVLRHAAGLVAVGVVAGLVCAAVTTRVLQSMLFETTTTDRSTFLMVPAVLALVAAVSSIIPAIRATRTDPIIAIRSD